MNIIDFIPFDHYISRKELEAATGQKDRKNRREIEKLRHDPATFVISSSNKKGYKRPNNYEELEKCRQESISRIKAELKKVQAIDVLINNRDQIGLGII